MAREDVRDFAYPPNTYDLALAANVYQFLPPDGCPAYRASEGGDKARRDLRGRRFSPAMAGWGAEIGGYFTASAEELMAYFPKDDGWLPLDRTEYWTYRPQEETMASFAYVVARKQASHDRTSSVSAGPRRIAR